MAPTREAESGAELAPPEFLRRFHESLTLRASLDAQRRHAALVERASVCSYCGVGCPYTVLGAPGEREQVVPLSELGLCVKGKTSLSTGGDRERSARLVQRGLADDRIRAPMLRGHDGKLKEVSWDEALDRAAWLFLHAREWVGPEAVGIYGNGQKTVETIFMASLYKLVFRLPTLGANSEHCLASAGAAHEQNFGNEAAFTHHEFDELDHCDVAVLHGTNAFVTFPQAYEKLKRNASARKVVIDPVTTDTATDLAASDPRTLHIRFRQGGDLLFNLAVSQVILEAGWEDREYLERAVDAESLKAFRRFCDDPRFSPESVARDIVLGGEDPGALARTIRDYAELIARPSSNGDRPRVAIISSMGINQSTGSYGFSTNLNLLLLTGNVGRPGAGSLRIAGQSNATSELMLGFNGRRLLFNLDPKNPQHREELARVLEIPVDNIPDGVGTPVARMADDDRLYCFLFIGTQMTRNMPRLGHWTRRLGRAFNVVIDAFLGDGIAEHADVVLPSLTHTERTGVIQRGDRCLQLQQPLTEPPPLAWSDEQILARLALKIAERLRDPDTAALNELDPEVVSRIFGRYVDESGNVDSSVVFDHLVSISRELDVYNRLEDEHGAPISHAMLRRRAGLGVQWQGNRRYHQARERGAVFPRLRAEMAERARLVRPPDEFLDQTLAPLPPGTLNLISGRGRPGKSGLSYRARYNSGVKTLPIAPSGSSEYHVELHPEQLASLALESGQRVRLSSAHGSVVGVVSPNDRIPLRSAFIDFVPGEVNRLTDYQDADRFTFQSFIKRTPVRVDALSSLEEALWALPGPETSTALATAVNRLLGAFRKSYPNDEDWVRAQRGGARIPEWLPARMLFHPDTTEERHLAEAVGAMTVFFQRLGDPEYRRRTRSFLAAVKGELRDDLLCILLPLLRRLDYQSVMHELLAGIVGPVQLLEPDGSITKVDLSSAHRSAVLEFKEEIVAIQLFVAAKRACELLFGKDAPVPRDALAFVSGIAIPCAGDVPAHFVGMSPADIGTERMIHSRAIGSNALMLIDRESQRAVRVDVHTGVLPKDPELTRLRGRVINKKRAATSGEHAHFFDRLGELVVNYVRLGTENFHSFGPVPLDWQEYRKKLTIVPGRPKDFVEFLERARVSPPLAHSLVNLGVLDLGKHGPLLQRLEHLQRLEADPEASSPSSGSPFADPCDTTLEQRIAQVVERVIGPVLENDGGRLEVLGIDEARGEVRVRLVGSCANCPYSLLSMEQLVVPSLLAVPGVRRVLHRGRPRDTELAQAHASQQSWANDASAKRALPVLS